MGELKAGTKSIPRSLYSFSTHNGVSLVFLSTGKSPKWLSCTSGMKRVVNRPLGPFKTLALTSVKVLEILSGLDISQSVETHIGGMWGEGLKGQRGKAFSSPKSLVRHLQPPLALQVPGWGTSMGTA